VREVNNTCSAFRYVIWSRVDQKTCLKAIVAANLTPVVIELKLDGDQLITDVKAVEHALQDLGANSIACVVTTTSCFAPRACDDVRIKPPVAQPVGPRVVLHLWQPAQSPPPNCILHKTFLECNALAVLNV
jgi:hypothetical protein